MKHSKIEDSVKITISSKIFNNQFRVKIYGNGLNTLVGYDGFMRVVGDVSSQLLKRALSCHDDKCVCKLRRGIQVTFYYR